MAQLKEIFFTDKFLQDLASEIRNNYKNFNKTQFIKSVKNDEWNNLELKQKLRHTTLCLGKHLPEDFEKALNILYKSAPAITGFDALVFPDYVEVFGIDHPKLSIPALGFFTQFCSSEFAIRPFIKKNSEAVMQQMKVWSKDKNHHLRRLSSEGCRPRLPWSFPLKDFIKDPSLILPILDNLKDDESEYVRKSVANNLNDISKNHPDLVLKIAKEWLGKSERTDWIIKHACRTMLKAGNPKAMILFGFNDPKKLSVTDFSTDKNKVKIGDDFQFEFTLNSKNKNKSKVRLEYAIFFVKAKGQLSKKVFQIKEFESNGEAANIKKKHSFKDRTTRKHHPGKHKISIIVNGVEKSELEFELFRTALK